MALATEAEILALAKGLTRGADALHARLLEAIARGEADQATAQRLFQDEAVLRQRAEALCLDAAGRVLADLQPPQAALLATVEAARARIARAEQLSHVLALAADLLVLAAAACAAQAPLIAAAWLEVARKVEAEGFRND